MKKFRVSYVLVRGAAPVRRFFSSYRQAWAFYKKLWKRWPPAISQKLEEAPE